MSKKSKKSNTNKISTKDSVDKDNNASAEEANQSNDVENDNNKNIPEKESETIIKLEKEIENLKEEKLRLLAEMDNLRKRAEKDRIDSAKYGSANLARDMLSPGDNMDRALEVIPKDEKMSESISNLVDGLKMIKKEILTILQKHGVEKIEAINKEFDHNYHQAMLEIETQDVKEGTVVKELQAGYTMHDRLLRPSMVGVSKSPKKQEKPDEK